MEENQTIAVKIETESWGSSVPPTELLPYLQILSKQLHEHPTVICDTVHESKHKHSPFGRSEHIVEFKVHQSAKLCTSTHMSKSN